MLPAIRNHLAMTPWTTRVNRLEGLFDRLFDDSFFGVRPSAEAATPLSLWQDEDHIYVEADLPGMSDQDVEVTVHKGVLFIRGERKAEEGRQYLYNGRSWGRFERAITLPDAVNTAEVQADLANGVLRVTLPRSPETRPRKITLKTS
jgi:HSP20 family protein